MDIFSNLELCHVKAFEKMLDGVASIFPGFKPDI